MTLPSFIVIGPGKTGTTWLYRCLAAHPEIRLARGTKETVFFNEYYDRGISWYERFFEGCAGARAIGEVSNNYFHSPEAPRRIAEHIPHVKLIATIRNPVDRLFSAYHYFQRWKANETFEEVVARNPRMVSNNYFDDILDRWLQFFPRERILVTLYDDVKNAPDRLLEEIYGFIGVDPGFRPAVIRERVLPPANPRSVRTFQFAKNMARWLRRNDMHGLLTWAKLNPLIVKAISKGDDPHKLKPLPADVRERYQAIYRPHVDRLEKIIGRDLSAWK